MQSKTSCFKTIIYKNITRFWPLWALMAFFGALIPFALIISESNPTSVEAAEIFYGGATRLLPVYSLLYASIVAMAVWGYLYTGKSVGLMHSLPITRNQLFAASFVSGMIMMLIPLAVAGILMELIFIISGCAVFIPFVLTAVVAICETFIFFSIATFMAHLTGHLFGLPVLYYILNFLAVLLEYVSGFYFGKLCYGIGDGYVGRTEFLSPLVWIYQHFDYVMNLKGYEHRYNYVNYNPANQYLEGWGTIVAYVILAAVLTVISLVLYGRRKSETAGEVVSAKPLRPVALACFTACAALCGGVVIFFIFGGEGQAEPLPLLAFSMILSTFIGWFAGQMLIQRKVRVFNKKTFLGYAIAACVCVFFLAVLRGGGFGRETYVPKADKIASASISTGGRSYRSSFSSDPERINDILDIHKQLIDQKADVMRSFKRVTGEYGTYYYAGSDRFCSGDAVHIYYTLKSGKRVERTYYVFKWADDDSLTAVTDKIDEIANGSKAMLEYIEHNSGDGVPYHAYVGNQDFSDGQAGELYDAIIEDLRAGRYKDYTFRNEQYEFINCDIEFMTGKGEDYNWSYVNLEVTPEMESTMEVLRKYEVDLSGFSSPNYRH